MATPTVYKWTDTDAPLFSSTSSYDGHRALISILKACLVDGYGSKSAAGWTLERWDETTNGERAAFSNGNAIIELIGHVGLATAIVIHESVTTWGVGNTDGSGGYGSADESCWSVGVNSQSSYNYNYTRDDENNIGCIYNHYYTRSQLGDETDSYGWVVIATDKTFMIFMINNPDGTNTSTTITSTTTPSFLNGFIAGVMNQPWRSRDEIGNFSVMPAAYISKTSTVGNMSGLSNYCTTLTNPFSTESIADERIFMSPAEIISHTHNYKSTIFMHNPVPLFYTGYANPDTYNSEEYMFATLPGFRQAWGNVPNLAFMDQISKIESTGAGRLKMDWITFDSYECLPCTLDNSGILESTFISTNPNYWP
jgi:hypothetical protein